MIFAANDVSGARHVALKIANIDEAFLHIQSMPDTRLINGSENYKVFQISETKPGEVHYILKGLDIDPNKRDCILKQAIDDLMPDNEK